MIDKLGVKIRLLHPAASVPKYATAGSAACDLTAATDTPITVPAHGRCSIPTGIAISMENTNTVAIVCARSGLAFKHALSLVNGIGVIDSDYRGEICVGLRNDSAEDSEIRPGERIAQMMFMPVAHASFITSDALDETERGTGGFGSTGKI